MAKARGQQQDAFMAYVQMRDLRQVRSGDLIGPLKLSAKQEQDLFSRLTRRGLIAQVRRGLYLVPEKLPLGGVWTPDEATAINALMDDKQARYQITGLNAFNRYGYDEQVPSRITLYNDAISGERSVGQVNLTLIKVIPRRLGGTESVETSSGQTLVYSSRVRTLVDAVHDWARFDSLPRAYTWIRRDVEAGCVLPGDLAKATLRYGNMGTIRRVGALLDQMGAEESILQRLQHKLSPSTAKIPLVPGRPIRGTLTKRWGVVAND